MSADAALARITFNATPRTAAAALDQLATKLGLSRTDVLNRAVQVYLLVDGLMDERKSFRVVLADDQIERIYVI